MKIFHKHKWHFLRAHTDVEWDWSYTSHHRVTLLTVVCCCGKVKTYKIADYGMTDSEMAEYRKIVFDEPS